MPKFTQPIRSLLMSPSSSGHPLTLSGPGRRGKAVSLPRIPGWQSPSDGLAPATPPEVSPLEGRVLEAGGSPVKKKRVSEPEARL